MVRNLTDSIRAGLHEGTWFGSIGPELITTYGRGQRKIRDAELCNGNCFPEIEFESKFCVDVKANNSGSKQI